mgnify:CR=1 FL=1
MTLAQKCKHETLSTSTYQAVFAILADRLLDLSCSPPGSHGCSQGASGHAFVANVVSTHGSTGFLLMVALGRMDQQIDARS